MKHIAGLLAAAILVSAPLAGCGSVYLHSDKTQEATARAKAELDKVNVAALFDNEAAYLDDLERRENAAIAESEAARRDDELVKMMQGTRASTDGDGRQFMGVRIDAQLKKLIGATDREATSKFDTAVTMARGKASKTQPLSDTAVAAFKAQGVDFTIAGSDAQKSSLATTIANMKKAADLKAKNEADARKAVAELESDLAKAAKDLETGKREQEEFEKLLKKVHDFLGRAKGEAANPYVGQFISESLGKRLDELIAATNPEGLDAPGDSKTRATLGFLHAAFGVGDAFSNPPRVPHPNALAVAQSWLRYEAGFADNQFKEQQAVEAAERARLDALLEQVLHLSLAGQELGKVSKTFPARNDEGFGRLLTGKDAAANRAGSAALYHYANAYSRGSIPALQIDQVTLSLIERRARLQRSRQAGEAWLGTLKPAVATLAAYGEGGLDPHLVAELLQVLGIGAIAVGEN